MNEPRINVYVCELCHGHTVTVDVDEGVTPMFLDCRANGKGACRGMAVSSMYPRGVKPGWIGEPKWEWYKPSPKELKTMTKAMREHVRKGGLNIRERTTAPAIMHPLDAAKAKVTP